MLDDMVDASLNTFDCTVHDALERFSKNRLCQALQVQTVTLVDYQCLLRTLFHQAYSAPYTYALAAYHCEWKHEPAKEYLLKHAEQKRIQWQWILEDLAATGNPQPGIRSEPAHPACAAYVALNVQTAFGFPLGRLAIGIVLEGIASRFGAQYVQWLQDQLKLEAEQISYLSRRAECSPMHWQEMMDVLHSLRLTATDWESMQDTARRAGELYKRMYDVIPHPDEAPGMGRDHKAQSAL